MILVEVVVCLWFVFWCFLFLIFLVVEFGVSCCDLLIDVVIYGCDPMCTVGIGTGIYWIFFKLGWDVNDYLGWWSFLAAFSFIVAQYTSSVL